MSQALHVPDDRAGQRRAVVILRDSRSPQSTSSLVHHLSHHLGADSYLAAEPGLNQAVQPCRTFIQIGTHGVYTQGTYFSNTSTIPLSG